LNQGKFAAAQAVGEQEESEEAEESETLTEGAAGTGATINPLTSLLQKAVVSMVTPWAPLALIWINIHVFGHSVLGEKVFCELGEEWVPANMRTAINSPAFKNKVKSIGLLEKSGLFLLDLAAFFALLALVGLLLALANELDAINPLNLLK
jgi:hypothetical protein